MGQLYTYSPICCEMIIKKMDSILYTLSSEYSQQPFPYSAWCIKVNWANIIPLLGSDWHYMGGGGGGGQRNADCLIMMATNTLWLIRHQAISNQHVELTDYIVRWNMSFDTHITLQPFNHLCSRYRVRFLCSWWVCPLTMMTQYMEYLGVLLKKSCL